MTAAPALVLPALLNLYLALSAGSPRLNGRATSTAPPSPGSTDGGARARPWQFHVAPMQGYTSLSLRRLYRLLSPDAVLWTEMEKAGDLLSLDGSGWERRLGPPPGDGGTILQIGGSDPATVADCVERASGAYGYDGLRGFDLNCGCPSIVSGGSSEYGASLMRKPGLTADIVSAMREAAPSGASVSVKTRIAAFDSADDYASSCAGGFGEEGVEWEEEGKGICYADLKNYISGIGEGADDGGGGADHVVLHARPAVLSGLSPAKNRAVPTLNYNIVSRAAADFPDLRITLNGGVRGMSDLESMLSPTAPAGVKEESRDVESRRPSAVGPCLPGAVASHMAGRWMLRRPLDLARVQSRFLSGTDFSSRSGAVAGSGRSYELKALEDYIESVLRTVSSLKSASNPPLAELLLPIYLVLEQLREDHAFYEDGSRNDGDGCGWTPHLTAEDIKIMYGVISDGMMRLEEFSDGGRSKGKSKVPSRDCLHFKKLSASFKGFVGTKVVNKWKRNRAEL